jgi:molybdopterin molybdotransferase
VAIAALAGLAGAEVSIAPLIGDDVLATERALVRALDASDVVVTVGGVSVGEHDVVRTALANAGVTLDFWKVRIKPGKPLAFGARGRGRVIGLPGNPVSAQTTFFLFGLPLLKAMQGAREPVPPRRRGRLAVRIDHKPGRLGLYRARLEGDLATPLVNQSSGAPHGLAWANALVVAPETEGALEAGASVELIPLSDQW